MAELKQKQKDFADAYLETGNAYQSAIKAGYSENYAKGNVIKLLENESVKTYIDARLKSIEDSKIASITEVMQYLTRGLRQEIEEEVLVTEGVAPGVSDTRIMTKKISIKDSNKCAEMLAKRFGILTDRVVLETIPIVIHDDIDDE